MDSARITVLIALSIKLLLVFINGVAGEVKERQYSVQEIREALKELPISWMAKKGENDDEKLPMAWMSKKAANVENENLPMAWMSKKAVGQKDKKASGELPMKFMWSKKSTDVCKRAIEVCSRSLNKRSKEEDILNALEGELKDKKVPL